jgi:predicted ATPase/class 3 adenylate cyclase
MVGERLPVGEVTLLFSDIEGSTRLLHEIGELFGEVLAEHDWVLREVWEAFGGAVVKTEGDAFFVAFGDAEAAVAAAGAAQRALAGHRWPHRGGLLVRMGVHTGRPRVRGDDYWGIDVHYAARLCSAASGGQVLLSSATRTLVPEASVDDLGEQALKDFSAPRRLFHLRVDGRGAAQFSPPRTVDVVRSNLPSPPNPLIGREREIEEVRSALTGDVRLLTLTGVGGTGKTRLAIACGGALMGSFPDGVFFVSVSSVSDEAAVPTAVADGIGVSVEDGRDPELAIVEHLSGRRALLVVDNMEHLLGAAPFLARLLESLSDVRLLVTSQAPLRLRSEVAMLVGPLELPREVGADIDALEVVPAVALFLERARAADPSFSFGASEAASVAELCRHLDGLPLALELAAARVRLLGPERLLAALERGIDGLGSGVRDLPARQRGLRAALDYTVSLLEEQPRQLFPALGAFADAWTVEQVERMFGNEIDVLDASAVLLDFSLIRTRGDGRLTMAEPVRAYAQELLAEQGREFDCRRRHALTLAEEAEEIHDEFVFQLRLVARAVELGREFAAAVNWSRGHDSELHRRLVAALGMPYYLASRLSLIADDIRTLVGEDEAADATSARLRFAHAVVLITDEDVEAAVAAAGEAGDCLRALGDLHGEAMAVGIQAQLLNQSNVKDARAGELVERVLTSPAAQHDPRLRALLVGELGIHHWVMGRLHEADTLLSEVVDDGRVGDSFIASNAMSLLVDCAVERGQFGVALQRGAAGLRGWGHVHFNALLQCIAIAAALAGLGHDAEAVELIAAAQAAAEREALGSLTEWFPPPQLHLLADANTRLGQHGVALAQQRGRGRGRDVQTVIDWAFELAEQHAPTATQLT